MQTPLPNISPLAWEHPADRAALNTLRALPGFDEVVKRILGFFGERGVRYFFLANAVRVGPNQRPKLDALYNEVLETLDWPGSVADASGVRAPRPQLYVTQSPIVNAAAVGFADPFIVINSETLRLLDREEQRFILAHEVGHIISGHVVYRTIALILIIIGIRNLPFLAGLAVMPFQLALLEWYRKSEFSADRAGLLGLQDPRAAMRVFLQMAGGDPVGDEVDLDDFLRQAAEYETEGGAWDAVLKLLNTAFRDHPFGTVRAAELQRWVNSGAYEKVLAGDYPRRGDPGSFSDDLTDASGYYGDQVKDFAGRLGDSLRRAGDAFSEAFRENRNDK
ncbi:MAG TPA: M48 family metallopeptidase [Gemmatimonadales bacterium]|nr:M48 family metallopeptidase [Gemmatimonadales bacterium]